MTSHENITSHYQNPEAERAVLGCVLLDPSLLGTVSRIVEWRDFYDRKHRLAFAAVARLGDRADLLTLEAQLREDGTLVAAGGADYVASLVDGIPDIANVERYAEIVRRYAVLRG